jgi:hypothetical protein
MAGSKSPFSPSFSSPPPFFLQYWGLNSGSTHLGPLHQPFFCEGFFEIGSHKLFAQAGFKPRSF